MPFNPTDIQDNVRTIPKYFLNAQMSEWDVINCFTCQIMSRSPGILFQLAKTRIGCYSTRLTFETMSEPFQIIFKCSKVGIRCNKLFHMPNNVRIALNIISIGQNPNRMLFNPTDIRDNVRTIPNNFQILKGRNRMILIHLYTTQCPEGPEYYFIVNYPESASIQSD